MVKINKELMYRGRFQALYMKYDTGQISWNEYKERLEKLNEKYES